jgi:dipeptidyl aminopeptidase/acylaminoacyl peptidase
MGIHSKLLYKIIQETQRKKHRKFPISSILNDNQKGNLMAKIIEIPEKYERNGWPSLPRPDLKTPKGWSISLITAHERIRNHRLSPDGHAIALIKDGESLSDIFTIPSAGGWLARITTNRTAVPYWADEIPQWSPDGKWLAFTLDEHVHILAASGGIPKKLTDVWTGTWNPRWMPDSASLIVSIDREDVDQLVLITPDLIQSRLLTSTSEGDHWDPQPSPDGKRIAYVLRRFDDINRLDICLLDLETGNTRTIYGHVKTRAWYPRWSPDGGWIAFICQQEGHDDLWLVNPDGTNLRQLTNLGHDIAWPAWSPDSSQIACTVNEAGAIKLVLVDPDKGSVTTLKSGYGVHSNPQWAPDGSFITFEYESPVQSPEIFRMNMQTSKVKQLTFSSLPAMNANKLVMPERVTYPSFDGLEIPAFLYKSEKSNKAGIVYVHGGPTAQTMFEWDLLVQYLVAKGYTVIAPNYRGSTGYGVEFDHKNFGDWGGGDTQDCVYGAKFLRQGGIDPARIAIMGGSYGGYMTVCALSRDPEYHFACGISKFGDSNLYSSWAQCSRELRLYTEIFLGHPKENRKAYIDGSPLHQVENVQKPVLILHGLLDDIVPPEASEEWVEALKRHGKQFEYKTYAGEPHGFLQRKNFADAIGRIERFLDWYLMV